MSDYDKSQTSFISATISVIVFGIIATPIISIIFAIQKTGVVAFDLQTLFSNMALASTADIPAYGTILLGWGIGGIIGGVRAKNSEKGALAGFFGGFLGGLLILILANSDSILNILLNNKAQLVLNNLSAFVLGWIGITIIAAMLGLGAGKATTVPTNNKPKQPASKSKTWEKKNIWKCRNCKKEVPPGLERCPYCGTPLF